MAVEIPEKRAASPFSWRAAVGALLGAIVGSAGWGVVSGSTGREVGYLAVAVGIVVGAGAVTFGGRGRAVGVLCAVLALVAIFAGKVLAVWLILTYDQVGDLVGRDTYVMYARDAHDFAAVRDGADIPKFMHDHGYPVTSLQAVEEFEANVAPMLRWMAEAQPSYQVWRPRMEAVELRRLRASIDLGEIVAAVAKGMGGADLTFALLGLVAAYRIPNRRANDLAEQRPRRKARGSIRRSGHTQEVSSPDGRSTTSPRDGSHAPSSPAESAEGPASAPQRVEGISTEESATECPPAAPQRSTADGSAQDDLPAIEEGGHPGRA